MKRAKRATKLRPSEGGKFHEPVGEKQENVPASCYACRKRGYHTCSCPPALRLKSHSYKVGDRVKWVHPHMPYMEGTVKAIASGNLHITWDGVVGVNNINKTKYVQPLKD